MIVFSHRKIGSTPRLLGGCDAKLAVGKCKRQCMFFNDARVSIVILMKSAECRVQQEKRNATIKSLGYKKAVYVSSVECLEISAELNDSRTTAERKVARSPPDVPRFGNRSQKRHRILMGNISKARMR